MKSQDVENSQIFSDYYFETPTLFASYRIGDFPQARLRFHPWNITGTQGVLLNAFDLLANKQTKIAALEIKEKKCQLHEFIEFNGPLILDSGAFNFQKHTEISIDPNDVLSIGLELGADISVVLDHPFLPKSAARTKGKRWKNTVENTRQMFDDLNSRNGDIPDGFHLMPVIHGHSSQTLKRHIDEIINICGPEPPIVGIGSLAPLARNGSKQKAIDIISIVRKLLPKSHIHCFSMGSTLLMLLAFYSGADSVDSQSWMLSAAFKYVQLPGSSWTRLSPREKEKDPKKYEQRRNKFADHLVEIITDEDFSIKDWDNENGKIWTIKCKKDAISYLDYLEDKNSQNHIHRRACHNLYAFNFEAKRVRDEKDNLESFVGDRLERTIYKRAFEHAVKTVKKRT